MSHKVAPTDQLVVPSHVLLRRLEDEMILLNLESDHYFALDEVAARFIESLDPSGSVKHVAATLTEEYDVDLGTVTADLLRLSGELIDAGLLELGS